MRHLIPAVILLISFCPVFGQSVTWNTSGSALPKADYTLHVSRDGQLYAYSIAPSKAAYRYVASARDWRRVSQSHLGKLHVISTDLAFAIETTERPRLVKFTDDFKTQTILGSGFGPEFRVRDYAIGPDTTIYLIGIDVPGIVRSKDLGLSWDTLPASVGIQYVGINVDAHHTIYGWNAEAVRSTDSGTSWEMVYYYHKGDLPARCIPYSEGVYVLTQNGVLYDGFDSLATLPKPMWFPKYSTLLEVDGSSLYYHQSPNVPQRSIDKGLQWDTLSIGGQPLVSVSSVTCDSNGIVYVATYDHGETDGFIYASSDKGSTWTELTQLTDKISVVGCDPGTALYGRNQHGIYISTNEGTRWRRDTLPNIRSVYSTSVGENGEFFAVCRDSSNKVVLGTKASHLDAWSFTSPMPFQDATSPYLASGRLVSGELWAVDAEGYFSVLESNGLWRNSFVLDVPGADIVTAASIDEHTIIATGYNAVYRSVDKGKTFRHVFELNDGEMGRVITSNNTQTYILTSFDLLYFSTDKGETWQSFAKPENSVFNDIVSTKTGTLYLATTSGVWRNLNGYNNPFVWVDISGQLKGLNIQHLALRGNKRLYAATTGGNIYYTDLPGSSVSSADKYDEMVRVYPNPARDICYLSGPDELQGATVECYAVTGICVLRTRYEGGIDVASLPCGVYHLVIRINTSSYNTRLVIGDN